eukprot:10650973-Karenia_brevis.AAC.1
MGCHTHGGGAFCGKDPTKADRSAANMCRQMATSVLKGGFCKHEFVQLSYAIGVTEPSSPDEETGMRSQRSSGWPATHSVQLPVE